MKYLLHEEVLKSNTDGVRLAIESGEDLNQLDDSGESALHWAVLRGDIDTVKILLEAGADPNVISKGGFTPKWSAVDFGLEEIYNVLTLYGGKVITDERFDRASWSVFKIFLDQSLPEEEE